MKSILWAATFIAGIGLGIYSVSSPTPRLDAMISNPHPKPCITSFVMNTMTEEVILMMKEKEHRIEIMHIPRSTNPDWVVCYGPSCLSINDLVTHIVTKERK